MIVKTSNKLASPVVNHRTKKDKIVKTVQRNPTKKKRPRMGRRTRFADNGLIHGAAKGLPDQGTQHESLTTEKN